MVDAGNTGVLSLADLLARTGNHTVRDLGSAGLFWRPGGRSSGKGQGLEMEAWQDRRRQHCFYFDVVLIDRDVADYCAVTAGPNPFVDTPPTGVDTWAVGTTETITWNATS